MNAAQCRFIDFEQVKDDYPDRVEGADCSSATVKPGEHFGEYAVKRENGSGSVHKPVIARDGGHFYGRCTCKGWKHHDGPCSHLIILRKLAVTNDVVIPQADDVEKIETPDDESENEQPDSSDSTDDGETLEYDENDVDESESTDDDVEQAVDEEAPEPPEPPAGAVDQSLEARYPRVAHECVHTADDGTEYITKDGLERIARQEGLDVTDEPLSPTWDGDETVAAWRGVVRDGDREVTDVGTAKLEFENVGFAAANLDEFASNRATNRAIRRATGISTVSRDEIDVDDQHDHDVEKAMRADRRTA